MLTHVPLKLTLPEPHTTQSFDVPPVQVAHSGEQGVQAPLLLNAPSGQVVPSDAVCGAEEHFVRSVVSCVRPVLQAIQSPDWSAHWVQPNWHAWQLPVESRKNPAAHLAHAVPLSAVVQPGRHVHVPPVVAHTPFSQLQLEGGLETVGVRQRPLPEIPSSQDVHPSGQAWHVGPKNPAEQDSHEVPLNPVGQMHVPDEEHTPEPEQGGEQAEDCISSNDREEPEPEGSWARSGTESHRIIRAPELEEDETAAQTLGASEREPAESGVPVDAFDTGAVGS